MEAYKNYKCLFKKQFILFLFIYIVIAIHSIKCQENVIELNNENFEKEIIKTKYGFILFYSTDCRYCKAIYPIYSETATEHSNIINKTGDLTDHEKQIKNKLENLGFFKINTTNNLDILTKYKITSIPTIIWYNNDQDHYIIYDSETEMPSYFFNFAKKHSGFDVKEINMENLIELASSSELDGQNILLFIGDIKDKAYFYKNIVNTAWNLGFNNLYYSNDDNIKLLFKLSLSPEKFDVLIFKIHNKKISFEDFESINITKEDFADELHLSHDGEDNLGNKSMQKYNPNFDLLKVHPIKKIERLLKLFSFPVINRFSHENEKIISTGNPTLVLVHDYEIDSQEYRQIMKSYFRIALKYRREIYFMLSSKYTKLTKVFTEAFRLYKEDFPALCLTSESTEKNIEIDKYRKVNKGTPISEENIIEFIEDWKNKRLKKYISSEDIPEKPFDEHNIYKLVADNFDSIINRTEKFILLSLCSDKLDVCTKFRERLNRISLKLKNAEKIMIAEFNPYLNEIEIFEIRYLPTLVLLPMHGDKLSDPKIYQGRLSTLDIVNWLKENTMLELDEVNLPIENILMKEEDLFEIKPLDLEQKAIARKVYEKMSDPVQRQLWVFPNKEEADLEQAVIDKFLKIFFKTGLKDEL